MSNIFFSIYEIDGRIKIDNFKSNLSIFITPWSIAHFTYGYMTQVFGISYINGFILHTIYELCSHNYKKIYKEIWTKKNNFYKGFESDSILNSYGDTFCFMIGMFLAKNYNNLYLFIFIFIVGLIFFSTYMQDYITRERLNYVSNIVNNTLEIPNTKFDRSSSYYYFDYLWIIISLVTFIKLYTKYNKNLINKKFI